MAYIVKLKKADIVSYHNSRFSLYLQHVINNRWIHSLLLDKFVG